MEGQQHQDCHRHLVTIEFENSEMIVDETWFVFDAKSGSLFLQRLRFFGDMALKRTTNSYKVWRDILNPEKMMDGEALTVYWNGQSMGSLVKKN